MSDTLADPTSDMHAGMNALSDSRQEVMASFSISGLVPISAAIAGSGGAITVDPMFSMNSGGQDERDQAFFRFRKEGTGAGARAA
jgi:hypothetical protein